MNYRLEDIPALLRTSVGRHQLFDGLLHNTWPVLSRLAKVHRCTLARYTSVVAVVGSFGKSTALRAISTALAVPIHPRYGGNSWHDVARAVLRIRPLQPHAVIEAGINGAGQMEQYARVIRPDIAVVMGVGSEHGRSLHTLERTRAEKVAMPASLPSSGLAVLNGDDTNVLWMRDRIRARIVTIGMGEANDVRASQVSLDWPRGTRFRLHIDGQAHDVAVRLIGGHSLYAILAALAVARAEGVSLHEALARLEHLAPTPGRMQPVALPNGAWLLRDEYKSAVETIHSALDVLAQIPARRFVALGEVSEPPGSQGRVYRDIGERLWALRAKTVFVGRGGRTYTAGYRRAGGDTANLFDAGRSVLRAAEFLRKEACCGDVILVKGRSRQCLDRIGLALQGRDVRCAIEFCRAEVRCESCPMLERGWGNLRPVT